MLNFALLFKTINRLSIVIFLIWSIFFYEDLNLGFMKGAFVLILSLISFGMIYFVMNMVPILGLFSSPLIPFVFELWQHDLTFGEFTDFAIYLTIFLFISEGFILFVIFKKSSKNESGNESV